MLEPQSQQIAQDFHIFPGFVATHWTFSYGFSYEPKNRWPQNRCFVRGFRQFSLHVTKCHTCHGICTLSPLDAALTLRFPKWACNTTRLKSCARHTKWRWRSPSAKWESSSENDAKVLRLSHRTTFDTLWNMLECHKVPRLPLDARLRDVWNLQSDRFCNTPNRHGHSDLIANRCKRLPTVANTKAASSEHVPTPRPPK